VYYNSSLRKTVRHLPGVTTQAVATAKPSQPEPKQEESEAVTLPHHESTDNEVFVPINFDKVMSIEGHDSQVVHVRRASLLTFGGYTEADEAGFVYFDCRSS
jgi:hypothetical protein